MSTTRRGFVAGALATAALPAVAGGAEAPMSGSVKAKQKVVRRGRAIAASPDGRTLVVAHDHRHTVGIVRRGKRARRIVDVGGQPLEVAISPDGGVAAVTTASWDKPGLALVDLRAAKLIGRADVGPAPFGVAFANRGRRLVVTGGEQEGTVHILDPLTLKVLAKTAVGRVPRGVTSARDGSGAWIALNGANSVVRVDARTGRVTRTVKTPRLPERVAVSPDAKQLLVVHGGRAAAHVSEINLSTGKRRWRRVGRQPAAAAWISGGRRLVTLAGAGEVVVLRKSGKARRRRVGGAPRGLAVGRGAVWTVDALTGGIDRVRT